MAKYIHCMYIHPLSMDMKKKTLPRAITSLYVWNVIYNREKRISRIVTEWVLCSYLMQIFMTKWVLLTVPTRWFFYIFIYPLYLPSHPPIHGHHQLCISLSIQTIISHRVRSSIISSRPFCHASNPPPPLHRLDSAHS